MSKQKSKLKKTLEKEPKKILKSDGFLNPEISEEEKLENRKAKQDFLIATTDGIIKVLKEFPEGVSSKFIFDQLFVDPDKSEEEYIKRTVRKILRNVAVAKNVERSLEKIYFSK
jgi:hypothetical protein